MHVVMYSKDECTLCEQALAWFAERPKIPVSVVKLVTQEERNQLYDRLGRVGKDRLMPQLILTEAGEELEAIGGLADLKISGVESLFG